MLFQLQIKCNKNISISTVTFVILVFLVQFLPAGGGSTTGGGGVSSGAGPILGFLIRSTSASTLYKIFKCIKSIGSYRYTVVILATLLTQLTHVICLGT